MTDTARRRPGVPHLLACAVLLLTMLPIAWQFLRMGYPSGDDLPFHLGSWQDAARQLRHLSWPAWDFEAAYGVGEPRFIFYPPLSWLLGALLRFVLAPAHATETFILIALAACWIGMYLPLRRITTSSAALVGASIYALAPYTLYTALLRCAFGELLASAFLPFLFIAALEGSPGIVSIALPLGLLWLTNVPTAITASYTLLAIGICRLLWMRRVQGRWPLRYGVVLASGTALGILLSAAFLLPALHASHFVRLDEAFSPGQRVADNFLLRHTAFTRRQVSHAASVLIAETIAALLLCAGITALALRRNGQATLASDLNQQAKLASAHEARTRAAIHGMQPNREQLFRFATIGALVIIVAFFLLPLSAPAWRVIPKLATLQFPFRLAVVLSFALAFAAASAAQATRLSRGTCAAVAVAAAVALTNLAVRSDWRDPRSLDDTGIARVIGEARTQLRPTVEYTPAGASTVVATSPGGLCPTMPQPAPEIAPLHWTLALTTTETCTLPIRMFPWWTVKVNGQPATLVQAGDGLVHVVAPAGTAQVEMAWKTGADRTLGIILSLAALLALLFFSRRQRVSAQAPRTS